MSDPCHCQNCSWTGDSYETQDIQDFFERVEPGEIMPCGECPECGALCQLDYFTLQIARGFSLEQDNGKEPMLVVRSDRLEADWLNVKFTHEGMIIDAVEGGEITGTQFRLWSDIEFDLQ